MHYLKHMHICIVFCTHHWLWTCAHSRIVAMEIYIICVHVMGLKKTTTTTVMMATSSQPPQSSGVVASCKEFSCYPQFWSNICIIQISSIDRCLPCIEQIKDTTRSEKSERRESEETIYIYSENKTFDVKSEMLRQKFSRWCGRCAHKHIVAAVYPTHIYIYMLESQSLSIHWLCNLYMK